MDFTQITKLMDEFQARGLGKLIYNDGKTSLHLELPQCAAAPGAVVAPVAAMPTAATASANPTLTAPMVGTFYAAASPESAPFVQVGQSVKKGQTICLIEAMKMMSEVPADRDCRIEEILVENGCSVEYGTALFRVTELPHV